MGRKCSICVSENRVAIEQDILNNVSYRNIGKKYGISYGAVRRHNEAGHIAQELMKSAEVVKVIKADNLFERINLLEDEIKAIKEKAKEIGNLGMALNCIDKQMKLIELFVKMKLLAMKGADIEVRRENVLPESWMNPIVSMLHKIMDRFPIISIDILVGLMAIERIPEGQAYVDLPDTYDAEKLKNQGYWNDTIEWHWEQRKEILGDLTFKDLLSAMKYPLHYTKGYRDEQNQ